MINKECLSKFEAFKRILDETIVNYQLQNLGEVYHNFSPEGFTAVVCLSESHISVHTWPEYNLVNYDIFLSNYKNKNEVTVLKINEVFEDYFQGKVLQSQQIKR